VKNVTGAFLCSACDHTISFAQALTLGYNTTDLTCRRCGEQWHMVFTVTSLEPLHIGTVETKRTIGYLVGDRYFSKGKMQ
jgi:hypothetical protein